MMGRKKGKKSRNCLDFMNLRTDLALERKEIITEPEPPGITCETIEMQNARVTRIEVINDDGERILGKPKGKYTTVEVPPFSHSAQLLDGRLTALSGELSALLPPDGTILVTGLGNDDITPDALGPRCCELLLTTRHISAELARSSGLGELRPVAAIVPGVLGKTGIETGETLAGIVKAVHPAAVITIDALAARRLSRLGCTVQLSDSGIVPGSGVGNARAEISSKTLGVPVISVGVPTVVDAATLAYDLLNKSGSEINEEELQKNLGSEGSQMMITPREIDLVIERAARLIAMSINCALQPHISPEDLLALVS